MSKKYLIILVVVVIGSLLIGIISPTVWTMYQQSQDSTYTIAQAITTKIDYRIYPLSEEEKDQEQLQAAINSRDAGFYADIEELFGFTKEDFTQTLIDAPVNRTLFAQSGDPYYYAIYELPNAGVAENFITMNQLIMQGYLVGFGNYVIYMPVMFDGSNNNTNNDADQSVMMAEFVNTILTIAPDTQNTFISEEMAATTNRIFNADTAAQIAGQKDALVFTNATINQNYFNNFIIYEQPLTGVTDYVRYSESGTTRPYHIIQFENEAKAKENKDMIVSYKGQFASPMYCEQNGATLLFFFSNDAQSAQKYIDAFLAKN